MLYKCFVFFGYMGLNIFKLHKLPLFKNKSANCKVIEMTIHVEKWRQEAILFNIYWR